ncbi:MAG: membrane protein insertase YidC [Acidobacteria bacterium]|nr:membrane protein insertase YidC [Acidobacteriota bacterium]MYF13644.1 membrane protein insertase YidC [Acidobacteriota bacterium]MYI95400.1 membrane protein insertase YidC [Acidobacteriota bacterium]
MERRVLLAFLLSFFVFLLFVRFFGPESAPPAPPAEETPVAASPSPAPDLSVPAPETAAPAVPAEIREAEREQTVTVETSRYVAEFSNRGGRLLRLRLLEHTDSLGAPLEALPQGDELVDSVRPLDVVLPGDPAPGRLTTALHEVAVDGQARTGPVRLELRDGESREIEFRYASADGLEVSKTVRLQGGDYRMGVSVSAIRGGAEQLKEVLFGPGIEHESSVGRYETAEQGVIESGGESRLFSFSEAAGGEAASLSAQAVGVASHYFAGLLVADPGQRYEARLEALAIPWESFELVPEDASGSRNLLVAHLRSAGTSEFTLFTGPKQVELLTELGVDIVEFGAWLRFLVVPIRQGLLWAYDLLGNYGWAIVLVTILISLLLAPLKHYSYVSIRRMQKISPQVKRIQDKYKALKPTDPKRSEMNQEMVALYREHNVSPIGGCLPMLLMIPFFFAFYRLLVVSVELRHAPFVFWVQDLSREDPYFILPLLMGASQLIMQKMTATQAEGIQAKIMMFMPVVFVLIMAWAPSGLVLYWFANNVISMGQQAVTSRIMDRREADVSVVEVAGKGKRNKGGPRRKLTAGR